MNPFTGGCHYAEECMGYTMACHSCPQLKNTVDDEYAAKMFLLKGKLFDRINPECLCVVTPSKWLGHCAQDSRMFRKFPKKVIEYGFDEHVFFPRDKNECRIKLGLPVDKKIILFASQSLINERKGMKYLISALRELQDENILLVSMGGTDDLSFDKNIMVNLGYINDEATAAIVYNSADVFVSPSLADNFPNTVCESMLCGTAVVAFSVGGISEQVTHETGLLAELKNTRSLKENIQFVLNNPEKYPAKIISKIATERWRLTLQAEKYIAVYKSLLN
jgi:glycosyltransferase involved in cell wall biosynthesis